jgi:cysteine-rich repeat protein
MDVLKFLFALALCGCLNPQAETCGSLLCPEGTVCTPGGCATQEAIDACANKADGDMCTTSEITFDGYCTGGSCQQSVCGNGKQEYGEVCDDGNRTPGDGCSIDCKSDETCGNGIVDVLAGEQCDSGILGQAADGCSSTCTLEFDTWTSATPPPMLGRYGASGALDALGRVVMFGGITNSNLFLSDTWEWDGTSWIERFPLTVPPARGYAMMAYDPTRHRTVLFGGQTDNGKVTNDVWEWDGVDWKDVTPTMNNLAERYGGGMAADPIVAGRVILYGGAGQDDMAVCTASAWDGSSWVNVGSPVGTLGNCSTSAAASNGSELVVFDGQTTYVYDGTWTHYTGAGPPTLAHASMAYDSASGNIFLFGGLNTGSNAESAEVWTWSGGAWSEESTGATCGSLSCARDSALLSTDPTSGVFMHGGRTKVGAGVPPMYQPKSDSYHWSQNAFVNVAVATAPSARFGAASTYDPLRGVTIVFGGGNAVAADADTWQWDGSHWQQLASAPSGPRQLHAMTYDRADDVTIAFGGNDGNTELRDTIIFNGSSWGSPVASLPAAVSCSVSSGTGRSSWLAYDEKIEKPVLVRGAGNLVKTLTYTWDSQNVAWTQVVTATAPPPRLEAAMTYDAAHGTIVLFGGISCTDGMRFNDTWLFDGTTWTQVTPLHSPAHRSGASMAYDDRTQLVIMFGGLRMDGALGETWTWDGQDWTQLALPIAPDPRYDATLAFDAVRANVMLFGGTLDSGMLTSEVWTYRFHSAAFPPELCALGSADTDGDTLKGCGDPDCQGRCNPLCRAGDSSCTGPHCGDGICSPYLEDYELCPMDCNPP